LALLLPGEATEAGSSTECPFAVPTLLTETTVAAGEEGEVSISFEDRGGESAVGTSAGADAMTTSVAKEEVESLLDSIVPFSRFESAAVIFGETEEVVAFNVSSLVLASSIQGGTTYNRVCMYSLLGEEAYALRLRYGEEEYAHGRILGSGTRLI
jgi:hypothetical protein